MHRAAPVTNLSAMCVQLPKIAADLSGSEATFRAFRRLDLDRHQHAAKRLVGVAPAPIGLDLGPEEHDVWDRLEPASIIRILQQITFLEECVTGSVIHCLTFIPICLRGTLPLSRRQ